MAECDLYLVIAEQNRLAAQLERLQVEIAIAEEAIAAVKHDYQVQLAYWTDKLERLKEELLDGSS